MGKEKKEKRRKKTDSVKTILSLSITGFRIPVTVVRDGGFVVGRKEFSSMFVVEFGVKSFCHGVGDIVFHFDVKDSEDSWISIWVCDLVSGIVILDVHKLRTFESHLLSFGNMDSSLIVTVDILHGDGESELFGELGKPTELLGCVE